MLYRETSPDTFTPWNGEAIGGRLLPRNIETLWTPADLAAIGLFKPAAADPIPEGKVSTGQTVSRIAGVVKYVHALEDAPAPSSDPNDWPLKRWQFMAMVEFLGKAADIETAIGAIADPLQRAVVMARYRNSDVYQRSDPLFDEIGTAVGLTANDIDVAWMTIATGG